MWCIPKVDGVFIERMEDILALYEKPYNPMEPVIGFDEKSKQLLKEIRAPLPLTAGMPLRRDYAYERNGTRNIFIAVEPKGGFRTTAITKHRKKLDFAREMERIIALPRYRTAAKLHIVLDNLNTHFETSFIETFGKRKARKLMRRIRFHYTPKHASWLNMAEIELSIMGRQCLNRRIPTESKLVRASAAWERRRNQHSSKINWKFTTKDARNVFKYEPTKLS